jgi:hypothetical protein
MTRNEYNGWTNYETWVVNLWLDNEQGSQEYWQEQAQECVQHAIDDDSSDPKNAATNALAELLKDQHDEAQCALVGVAGVFADLLNAALSEVDWYEIAEHYISEIELYSAGWNMPGYMPDNPPSLFTDFDTARDYIVETMGDHVDDDQETDDDENSAVNNALRAKEPFDIALGDYVYWVARV